MRRIHVLAAWAALASACSTEAPPTGTRAAVTAGAAVTRAGTIRTATGALPGLSAPMPVGDAVAVSVTDGTVWWTDGFDAHAVGTFVSPQLVGAVGDALLVAEYAPSLPRPGWLSVAGGPALPFTAVGGVASQRGAVMGGVLYFAGWDAAAGTELWRTDGTATGTWRVADASPGAASSSPRGFLASGDRVYFAATDPVFGNEPWVTDGTEAGTYRLKDVFVGGSSATNYVAADGRGGAFFSASRMAFDKGLWHTDGTEAGTERLSDVDPGTGRGAAFGVVLAGVTFFHATDAVGTGLWRSDGTTAGTALVRRGTVWAGATPTLAALDGHVYFAATDAATGLEPWRTDAAGAAEPVADLAPGPAGSIQSFGVLGLPEAGVLVFGADDGASGWEPWVSDGTAAGTSLLQDLVPGAGASNANGFTRAGGRVFFVARDPVLGGQVYGFPLFAVDRRAPTASCPADLGAEATGPGGAAVSYPPASASDAVTASPALAYSAASGATFPLGETAVTATATDEAGNAASCSFRITVRDTTPPAIACPANVRVRTSRRAGVYVSFPAPTATDAVTAAPAVSTSPASGALFPVGTTTVTGTAVDEAGNTSSCTFTVTVRRS